MSKLVKLSGKDVSRMVNQIIEQSTGTKAPVQTPRKRVVENQEAPKKGGRIIRLTESEMIEFLDKLATKVENGRRRRSK